MNRIHIEFQRVQTWLFAVPRLRVMVGANATLGRVLRIDLPELAKRGGANWVLAPVEGDFPPSDAEDPLRDGDDPFLDAAAGILSRDGGHFEAQFERGADEFAREADLLLRRELPGLRFRVHVDGVEREGEHVHLSNELPVLAPCEWSGSGLSSAVVRQGPDASSVSMRVARCHEEGRRALREGAADLASSLARATALRNLRAPESFEDLVGSGYLAVIHADGNGVGQAARAAGEPGAGGRQGPGPAAFFHRNRVLLRRALRAAIDQVCEGSEGAAPLVPLMLGGDDLLVVCRAETALQFTTRLCTELERIQHPAGKDELTLGIGVVIARRTIPFHRLHEVAERLAASAKRRYRGAKEAGERPRSVVDWAVYSTAWVDDPEKVRRRDWVCGERGDLRVLSRRPLDVLGTGLDTLQGLLAGVEKLGGAPRSQLRHLADQLGRGRTLSELALKELSPSARNALAEVGIGDRIWQRSGADGPWLTSVLDLVEISEIARLGRTPVEDPDRV